MKTSQSDEYKAKFYSMGTTSFSQTLEKPLPSYQEQSGFWFRMDTRLDKAKNKAKRIWQSKPLYPVRTVMHGIKLGWKSKWVAPVRLPITYILKGIRKVTSHPAVKLGSTVYFIAMGIHGAIAAAATGGIGLAVVLGVGVGAGVTAKIIKNCIKSQQKNKIDSLEKQLSLLLKLKESRNKQNQFIEKISNKKNGQQILEKIKQHMSKKVENSKNSFHRTYSTKSKNLFTKHIPTAALEATSMGVDAYSAIHGAIIDKAVDTKNAELHHTLHHTLRAAGHGVEKNVTLGIKTVGKDIPITQNIAKNINHSREYENKLKQQINDMAQELYVPEMKNSRTKSLAHYVRENISDCEALEKIASIEESSLDKIEILFKKEKNKARIDPSLDLQEQSRSSFVSRIATHNKNEFFGTRQQWLAPIKYSKEKLRSLKNSKSQSK